MLASRDHVVDARTKGSEERPHDTNGVGGGCRSQVQNQNQTRQRDNRTNDREPARMPAGARPGEQNQKNGRQIFDQECDTDRDVLDGAVVADLRSKNTKSAEGENGASATPESTPPTAQRQSTGDRENDGGAPDPYEGSGTGRPAGSEHGLNEGTTHAEGRGRKQSEDETGGETLALSGRARSC